MFWLYMHSRVSFSGGGEASPLPQKEKERVKGITRREEEGREKRKKGRGIEQKEALPVTRCM